MDEVESKALFDAIEWSLDHFPTDQPFGVETVRDMHRRWLGDIYDFAGDLRTVNLSKGGLMFAPVEHLEMSVIELNTVLLANSPCEGVNRAECVSRIALVHAELILVHPFREGNGRLARWLADLMALQADLPFLDWNFENDTEMTRQRYFAALRKGFVGDLADLEQLVDEALTRSLRSS
jgi:cell filamentation protein